MKGFFKKHPELLILLIVVIVIDAVIVYMWLDDKAATAKSQAEHKKLVQAADEINKSKFKVSAQNAKLAEDEATRWEEDFNKLIADRQEKYSYAIKEYDQKAKARIELKKIVDGLLQLLKDKNKTTDKLSMVTYVDDNTLLNMEKDDIKQVFTLLNGIQKIVNLAVTSDIISLDSVVRPNDLAFVEDKALKNRRYTFNISFSATADGFKKLINQIVNDEKYFFEINSVKINAIEQVSISASDIIPNIKRLGGSETPKPRGGGIRDLEEGFDELISPDKKKEVDPEESFVYKDSISPFSQAINNVEISIDWIQFTKE